MWVKLLSGISLLSYLHYLHWVSCFFGLYIFFSFLQPTLLSGHLLVVLKSTSSEKEAVISKNKKQTIQEQMTYVSIVKYDVSIVSWMYAY